MIRKMFGATYSLFQRIVPRRQALDQEETILEQGVWREEHLAGGCVWEKKLVTAAYSLFCAWRLPNFFPDINLRSKNIKLVARLGSTKFQSFRLHIEPSLDPQLMFLPSGALLPRSLPTCSSLRCRANMSTRKGSDVTVVEPDGGSLADEKRLSWAEKGKRNGRPAKSRSLHQANDPEER